MARPDRYDDVEIGRELEAARPEASDELVSRIAARVHASRSRQRPSAYSRSLTPRVALAFGTTVALLAVAAAFGGVSQAASGISSAVTAVVHIGQKPHAQKPSPAATRTTGARVSSAAAAQAGATGTAAATGGAAASSSASPSQVQPSQAQYSQPCASIAGVRGPFVHCRIFPD